MLRRRADTFLGHFSCTNTRREIIHLWAWRPFVGKAYRNPPPQATTGETTVVRFLLQWCQGLKLSRVSPINIHILMLIFMIAHLYSRNVLAACAVWWPSCCGKVPCHKIVINTRAMPPFCEIWVGLQMREFYAQRVTLGKSTIDCVDFTIQVLVAKHW